MPKKKNRRTRPKGTPPPWTPFQSASAGQPEGLEGPGFIGTFLNSRYQVGMREFPSAWGPMIWLAIVNRDRSARHDWRDFQRVKNELCGPDLEAVEVYPAESRLVDTNNQFHLFVFPHGVTIPLGYMDRDVADQLPEGSAHKQRPFPAAPEGLNAREPGDVHSRIFATSGEGDS